MFQGIHIVHVAHERTCPFMARMYFLRWAQSMHSIYMYMYMQVYKTNG